MPSILHPSSGLLEFPRKTSFNDTEVPKIIFQNYTFFFNHPPPTPVFGSKTLRIVFIEYQCRLIYRFTFLCCWGTIDNNEGKISTQLTSYNSFGGFTVLLIVFVYVKCTLHLDPESRTETELVEQNYLFLLKGMRNTQSKKIEIQC